MLAPTFLIGHRWRATGKGEQARNLRLGQYNTISFETRFISRLLSRSTGPAILIRSADAAPALVSNREAWVMRCGKGNFSCCQRSGGKPHDCDKSKVAKICRRLISAKLKMYLHLHKEKTQSEEDRGVALFRYRWLLSQTQWVLFSRRVMVCAEGV